jgi:predicted transcriptional regulator
VDREKAAQKAVRQLLTKFFSGSPGELVLSFLKDENLSEAELDEIKQQIRDSAKPASKK